MLEPQLHYENEVAIGINIVDMATSLALRSGLGLGEIVRTLGGEYTGAWRDVESIPNKIESFVSLEDYQHVKRILTEVAFPS